MRLIVIDCGLQAELHFAWEDPSTSVVIAQRSTPFVLGVTDKQCGGDRLFPLEIPKKRTGAFLENFDQPSSS